LCLAQSAVHLVPLEVKVLVAGLKSSIKVLEEALVTHTDQGERLHSLCN
jgi:hypothetical protein